MQHKLITWYMQNKRDLPWRQNRDPYRIWISETMLQQTTTTAVIPFFERFVDKFPNLESLARAPVEQVLKAWAGLGYYSRAKNLHKSAQTLYKNGGFSKSYTELIELPGFGPYTARSVASLAFDESVGVVDGNVIRVLSRIYGKKWQWWKPSERQEIQKLADELVLGHSSYQLNQAVMELGRTICTPKSIHCGICPIQKNCQAYQKDMVTSLPLAKPRKAREIWLWQPEVRIKSSQVLLTQKSPAPFLKNQWLLPGPAKKLKTKPKTFDYRHSITHHDIYVQVKKTKHKLDGKWIPIKEIREYAQSSLVDKALKHRSADRS